MPKVSRREFFAATLAAGLAACIGANVTAKPKSDVFLAVDDLRPALNCYGAAHVHSPNTGRLAARWVRFDRAYCQPAVCAPSRIGLLTGLRPVSTTICDLDHPMVDVIPGTISLPHHFKNNGCETVSIGKVYHHGQDDPEAWSVKPWKARGEWRGRGYMREESGRLAAAREREALVAREKAKAAGGNANKPRVETDTRIPMILADPDHGLTAGQGTRVLSGFVDVYPALAELCGLPIPPHYEGSSMAPPLPDRILSPKRGLSLHGVDPS